MKNAHFHLFKDFLSVEDHQALLDYVKSGIDFQPSNDRLSRVKFKQITHSIDSSISYLRPYISLEGENGEFDYPPTVSDWSYFRHYPTQSEIKKIVLKIDLKSLLAIFSIFGGKQRGIYDNFLLKYSDGRSLRMHVDTYEADVGEKYKASTFSAVYYINDDFEGGEFHSPLLGIRVKPLANTMVLISNIADEDSCHEITKVTSGERFSWQQVWESD